MQTLIKKLREIRDYCDTMDDQPLDRIDEVLARTHDGAITRIRDMAECAIEDATVNEISDYACKIVNKASR